MLMGNYPELREQISMFDLKRRAFLSRIAALPVFASPLIQALPTKAAAAEPVGFADDFVIVNGWVLKRSDLADLPD